MNAIDPTLVRSMSVIAPNTANAPNMPAVTKNAVKIDSVV